MLSNVKTKLIKNTINACYGFRPGHLTEHSSVTVVSDLIQHMDSFKISISILIDLSKTFDTLDLRILLSKPRLYGTSEVELNISELFLQ